MIASEPLTFEERDWMEVKTNTMVVITPQVGLQGHATLSMTVANIRMCVFR